MADLVTFNQYIEGFSNVNPITGKYEGGWDIVRNDIYSINWADYNDPNNAKALQSTLNPSFVDYLSSYALLPLLLSATIHSVLDRKNYIY